MSCGCGREQTQNVTKLQNQIARLEGELAALAAALRGLVAWVESQTQGISLDGRGGTVFGRAKDALSGEGKGWLSPEVREQVFPGD